MAEISTSPHMALQQTRKIEETIKGFPPEMMQIHGEGLYMYSMLIWLEDMIMKMHQPTPKGHVGG